MLPPSSFLSPVRRFRCRHCALLRSAAEIANNVIKTSSNQRTNFVTNWLFLVCVIGLRHEFSGPYIAKLPLREEDNISSPGKKSPPYFWNPIIGDVWGESPQKQRNDCAQEHDGDVLSNIREFHILMWENKNGRFRRIICGINGRFIVPATCWITTGKSKITRGS